MGNCSSSDPSEVAHNLVPAADVHENPDRHKNKDRSQTSSHNSSRRGHNSTSSTRHGGHSNGNLEQSIGSSASTQHGSRRPKKKPSTTTGDVHFPDFKDRERNVVNGILDNNKHLRMAGIDFNDLKLEKIIGAGNFGEVIKGTYYGTIVVVKRMLRNKINEEQLRMFSEEIQLMMNLRHPNIVQFIGASWNSYSNVCLVTEFLERGDLYSVLKNPRYKLTWADPLLPMTIDTCRGMAYLHSMKPPIIHRDLKSMNILVSKNFTAKVSDFGLSREKAVDDVTMTQTGTPLWLPPEMIRGEKYTEKVDIYSFGIVLSELDTRRVPYYDLKAKGSRFKKVSGGTLLHMVAYEGIRPSLSANCLVTIQDLYKRCTSDDPNERPTFQEIIEELLGPVQDEVNARKDSTNTNALASDKNEQMQMEKDLGVICATQYVDENTSF